MSDILNQQQQDLQLQLQELVKVGVGGKFKDNSDYTKRIQEETGMGSESKLLDQFSTTQENIISLKYVSKYDMRSTFYFCFITCDFTTRDTLQNIFIMF